MNRRRTPIGSRLVTAVERTVRICLDSVDPAGATRRAAESATRYRRRFAARSGRLEAAADPPNDGPPGEESAGSDDDHSIASGIVDPESGPTSRSDVLEYGVTPEEYVRAVLVEHGGRIKQRRFADRYGWAHATLSRLLSDLEERDVIDRYRLGREKVVCLPDAIPESAR
ncbi:helix-turn-helix transcriptional regulator [Natrinema amylolyticum]|uniref:helix-turn-helix transcriptional regulator n=1 Tax=Natrinema amylolyticum TaxID=2878679 RepID=UPI001CFA1806|nr:MarR family transcriptional regulator [Natrinema amylolyticum]